MNFQVRYELFRAYFERALSEMCAAWDLKPPVLAESMRYSLLSGGKRIRPVLLLGTLDLLGCPYEGETNLALAIECIHTYSLIHDDLPAMDNDDYRRGRLSNHKMFGEANAILAGDGLLSYAFGLLIGECGKDERHRTAARILSEAAGIKGMVAGQSADLFYERRKGDGEALAFIHRNKTAQMIAAPVRMAAALAEKYEEPLSRFGESLGMLFQVTDDLLDEEGIDMGKTPGKDAAEEKLTAVSVYGRAGAKELAKKYEAECLAELCAVPGSEFLAEVTALVATRKG